MNKTIIILLLASLSLGGLRAQIAWPDGKKAAVVLTYDDGLKSQLDIVIPQLEAKNFRGTFFLYAEVVKDCDVPDWREAGKRGHELGNHSLFHPCLSETVDPPSSSLCRSLECYSVKDILREIGMMNTFLYAIDGKKDHAYAYPCGQSVAGGEDYSAPLLKSGMIRYCRGGGGRQVITDAAKLDPAHIPAFPALTGCKAEELIGYVQKAIDQQGLGIIVFHGVGGDYLTVDAAEHQKLVDFLAAHSNEIWVGTFTEVLDYVSAQAKK